MTDPATHTHLPPPPTAANTCAECGHTVSTAAMACPGCGRPTELGQRPQVPTCLRCGSQHVGQAKGTQGAESVTCLILLLLALLPGVLYYVAVTNRPWCPGCNARVEPSQIAPRPLGQPR